MIAYRRSGTYDWAINNRRKLAALDKIDREGEVIRVEGGVRGQSMFYSSRTYINRLFRMRVSTGINASAIHNRA